MELDFQYILGTMILSSMGTFMFFAYHYIHMFKNTYREYIQQVVGYSCWSMAASGILVFKLFIWDYPEVMSGSIKMAIILGGIVSILLILIVVSIQAPKKINFKHPYSTAIFTNGVLFFYVILVNVSYRYYYYATLGMYALIVVALCYRIYKTKKEWFNVGMYYIISSLVVLLISNLVILPFSMELKMTIEISLMVLGMMGLFIFYNNYYVQQIEKQFKKLKHQANMLNDSNINMKRIVMTDEVTGINNRFAFEKQVDLIKQDTYIVLINVRNFMNYNNLLGFSQGNELLRSIAREIKNVLECNRNLYRFYSDKFILVLDTDSKEEVLSQLEIVSELFTDELRVGLMLDLYYGMLLFKPNRYMDIQEKINDVINSLEVASAEAREIEKGCYEFTSMDMQNFKNSINLEIQLVKAIANNDFDVLYQPQVDRINKKIVSYEALVRWTLNSTNISPDIFIPMAEAKGQIAPITYFVIERVFEDIASSDWLANGHVSINLSAMQLIEPDLNRYIEDMISKYPGCEKNIIFEITETTLFMDVEEVGNNISRLIDLGFKFSLDDFGSGYSSLYRFAKLDIEEVKFDKVFVTGIIDNPKLLMTFQKTIELFKSFGMRIVAEGVEYEEQLKLLDKLEVDLYQGYYFYHPMSLEEIVKSKSLIDI